MKLEDILTKKVLVVDDMPSIRDNIVSCLKTIGFKKVNQAENGKQALGKIREQDENQFEFIFTDINMPEMNGIEFVKVLRADPTFDNTPIIVISTENESATVMEAIYAGASNYIIKPFRPDTLKQKIMEVFKIKD
ncbi:putative chemotaxis protein Chey [Bacteriovorax sp. BSW11_IV]|uniref:response regulator n=1 Tax=Bacteriovorax sp. BSW11_IV TaxID=1353529 RepID=UPI00038A2F57|nr:response regulator [Bacteriovorax sp. BSW11_IV]EQC49572.1 putative chemotaxis protein Chey [Bacteriovorax sp. BSW11_IV]